MSFTSAAETYWTISSYEGCPKNLIITTVNECMLAAKQLGLSFGRDEENYRQRPGCNTRSKSTFFNYATTDYSPTTLNKLNFAVCRSGSIGFLGV